MELTEIRHIVKEIDGSAFVTISDVSEILGEHINKENVKDANVCFPQSVS